MNQTFVLSRLYTNSDIIDVIILLLHIPSCLFNTVFSDFLQNAIDEAIEMYQELHMWDDCIAVAETKVIIN